MPPSISNAPARTGALVLRGASLRFISMFVNLVGTFFLMPFMLFHLGDYWYGMWAIIGAVVVQYHILDFGLSQTIVRFVSRYRSQQAPEKTAAVFSTALAAFSLFGLVTFGLITGVALNLDRWISEPEQLAILPATILLVGASMCCAFPTYALEGCYSGALRQDIPSLLQIARTLVRLSLTWYFIGEGYSIMALACISFACDTAYRVLLVLNLRRTVPEARFHHRLVSRRCLMDMLRFGRFVFLTNIARYSIIHTSMLVAGMLVGVPAAATYAIALNIIDRLEAIVRMGLFLTMPAFAGLAAAGGREALLTGRFLMVARIAGLAVALVCGGLIAAGDLFITAWMGADYADAYWPLLFLAIAWMLDLAQIPALQVLTAMGRHKRFAFVDLSVAGSSLALAAMLAPEFGLAGVAAGVALPVAISAAVLKPHFLARALQIAPRVYYGELVRVIGGTLLLQVPAYAVLRAMPPMDLGTLALAGVATYGPVGALAATILLPASDQRYMLNLMPARLARPLQRLLPHLRQPA